MSTALAARTCPSCGSDRTAFWRLASASDQRLAASNRYALDRCADCGTAVIGETVAEESAQRLYGLGTYRPTADPFDRVLAPLRSLLYRERMRSLRGLKPGARVLDVGAGDGRFLAALTAAGYDAGALEPYRGSALGSGRIERATIEDANIPPTSQDAVVVWHVLEHVEDPEGALRRISTWLKPGGLLVVAVPNLASLQAQIGGDRWFHQDVPRHRTQFTPAGVTSLLSRSGFAVQRIRHVGLDQNLLGMWQTLMNRLTVEPDVLFGLVKRNLPHGSRTAAARDLATTVLIGPLLLPVAALVELVAGARRRGGSLVIQATAIGES